MQEWFNRYFPIVFPIFFVSMWIFTAYLAALTSGWRQLAKRFRTQAPFAGRKWRMQSANMRWFSNYNNVLTIGADEAGLFMVPMILFRVWHPPLFISWNEISVAGTRQVLFVRLFELRLGRLEDVPFRIRGDLAAKLQAAAGPSWPAGEYNRGMQAPPPPIA